MVENNEKRVRFILGKRLQNQILGLLKGWTNLSLEWNFNLSRQTYYIPDNNCFEQSIGHEALARVKVWDRDSRPSFSKCWSWNSAQNSVELC